MSEDKIWTTVCAAFRKTSPNADGSVHLPWELVRPILVAMKDSGCPVFPGEIPPL
jgi:hypothetical protein